MRAYASQSGEGYPCDLRSAAKALISVAGDLPPSKLSIRHLMEVRQMWDSLGYAATTRYGRYAGLRRLVRHLEVEGAKPGIHRTVAQIPRPSPRPNTATNEELNKLIAAADLPLRLMILLCSDLALRSGTACKVAPCHRDVEKDTITIRSKFGRVVKVPITDRLRHLLDLCTHEPSNSTTPYVELVAGTRLGASEGTMRRRFAELRERLGIREIWFHDLRRTTAHNILNVTGDLRLVQTLLGHHSLSSTFHYLDRGTRQLEAAHLELAIKDKGGKKSE